MTTSSSRSTLLILNVTSVKYNGSEEKVERMTVYKKVAPDRLRQGSPDQ